MTAAKAIVLAAGRISVRIVALAAALLLGGPADSSLATAGFSPKVGPAPVPPPEVQRIEPRDAARIKYTKQRFVYLDVGETAEFSLRDGRTKRIRLVSVREDKDSVIGLVRRADVRLEIEGAAVDAVCAPCVEPIEIGGLRLQVDTTSAWLAMGKRVQLSLWDAADPVVDTALFGFPLRRYALFSQGT